MTEHPITPPPELVGQWLCSEDYLCGLFEQASITITTSRLQNVATQAAQWGADQELEACCEWLRRQNLVTHCALIPSLRVARRPKLPSLKEQALDAWDRLRNEAWCQEIDADLDFVRRALEQLDD